MYKFRTKTIEINKNKTNKNKVYNTGEWPWTSSNTIKRRNTWGIHRLRRSMNRSDWIQQQKRKADRTRLPRHFSTKSLLPTVSEETESERSLGRSELLLQPDHVHNHYSGFSFTTTGGRSLDRKPLHLVQFFLLFPKWDEQKGEVVFWCWTRLVTARSFAAGTETRHVSVQVQNYLV